MYNSGKKSVELDKLYTPGRYYVGAGSYFLEFPSIQKTIIFRSDAKQNFDTNGAFITPVIRGLTKDGLILNMSVVMNYKVLDYENTAVKLQNQLFTIFNQLYGGNIKEEISDSVGLVAEAAFLDVITTYNAEDFSVKRNEIGYNMFLKAKASLKDYYLTCTSVFIINQEFVAGGYGSAISDIAAEIQRIEEKNNLYLSEQVIAQTNEALSLLDKDMDIASATSRGVVYEKILAAKAAAIIGFNSDVQSTLAKVKAVTGTLDKATVANFYYLLAMKMSPAAKNLYLYHPKALLTPITT